MQNGSCSRKGGLPKGKRFVLTFCSGPLQNMQRTVTQVESYHVYICCFQHFNLDVFHQGFLFFSDITLCAKRSTGKFSTSEHKVIEKLPSQKDGSFSLFLPQNCPQCKTVVAKWCSRRHFALHNYRIEKLFGLYYT